MAEGHESRSPHVMFVTLHRAVHDHDYEAAAAIMGAPSEAAGELEVEFRGEREEILVCLENATIICFDGFGGPARAAKLSKAELSKIGKKAAAARWDHPKATHAGELKFGEIAIPCAVLEDGRRVVSQRGFYKGLGGKSVPTKTLQADPDLPAFLSAKTLQPFISDRLKLVLKTPIKYRIDGVKAVGGGIAHGIPAEVIPDICDVYQQAKEAGGLHYRQEKLADNAYAILRALGHVGIVADIEPSDGGITVRCLWKSKRGDYAVRGVSRLVCSFEIP